MAFDACVKDVLCGLSLPVLRAIEGVLDSTIASVQATIAILEARSLTLGVQLIPVQLAIAPVQLALDQALSISNVLPSSAIEDCGDLGSIRANIASANRAATADLQELNDDLNRKLSTKRRVDAESASLSEQLAEFQEAQTVVQLCIAEQST